MNPRRPPSKPATHARRSAPQGRGQKPGTQQRRIPKPKKPRLRAGVKQFRQGAQNRLRQFRQGSALAVALTALILMIWVTDQQLLAQGEESPAAAEEGRPLLPSDPDSSLEQATETVRELMMGFYSMWPRVVIAVILISLAILLGRTLRTLLQRTLGKWERTTALSALGQIIIVLMASVAALSVLAGDARALFGSIGLVGLALSWALQTPIESFTGWLMNSFRGYYRVGDRIEVGEVFGDVYKIDVLTTTVWEAGGPGKPVAGAQATGAMITFPNWEVLRSNIINYSRDFPYVWDEVTVNISSESDLRYTVEVFERVARDIVGEHMAEPARKYHELLARARLAFDVEDEPKAFISLADAWADCTVRYLVPARTRRRWASELSIALTAESEKPEHRGKIIGGYPRQELRLIQDWHDEVEK
jgi:small conductance mechanosensitive channel